MNNFNSKPHYEKIISGNPFEYISKDHKFQSDSLAKLCPGSFGSKSSADFSVKVMNVNNDSSKNLNKITSILNVDQKLIYARKLKSKYIRTDTISPEGDQKWINVNLKSSPFHKNFNYNTQSKLRNAESKRPHSSMINHSKDNYDVITRMRSNKTAAPKNNNFVQGWNNKSQTISAFNHTLVRQLDIKVVSKVFKFHCIGRIYAPNFSREYQKAYNTNQNQFKRPKGMWSEMLNSSQKHAFIAKPFGNRSQL